MGDIYNAVASEFEMPKLQPLNLEGTRPMLREKRPKSDGDRICNTCNKEDVCMYKKDLVQAAKEITQISERTNVFIDIDIKCQKWSGKDVNFARYPLCKIVKMGANPRCSHLINNKYCNDKNILCIYQEI